MNALITKKIGMTRMLDAETGALVPVTVLQAPGCDVLQVKTQKADGYDALVLGSYKRKKEFKNVGKQYEMIQEVCLKDASELEKGASIGVAAFVDTKEVKLTGVTKGRGFQGVIKRWGFSRGPETHGSHHHREPGSVGMCSKPGRILKGKKLPGHYGVDQKTLRNVKIVAVDVEKNLIAVRGSVPGAKKGFIFLQG